MRLGRNYNCQVRTCPVWKVHRSRRVPGQQVFKAFSSGSQSSVMQNRGPLCPQHPNASSPINSVMVLRPHAMTSALSVVYTVNVTALGNASQWLQDRPAIQTTVHSILNNGPQPLNFSRANSKEAVRPYRLFQRPVKQSSWWTGMKNDWQKCSLSGP